jgi:uncharacterized protein
MNEQLRLLFELQQIDSAIMGHQRHLVETDDGARTARKLQAAQAQRDAAAAQAKAVEGASLDRDLELKGTEEDLKKRKQRAYGGTISDTKELGALERKIQELTRHQHQLEDDILGLMEQSEAAGKALAVAQAEVDRLQQDYDHKHGDWENLRAAAEQDVKQLQVRRREIAVQLEPEILTNYESLRSKCEGVAVATVEGGMCLGCRNAVPGGVIGQVKAGHEIIKCQNCRRILYLPS